METREKLVQAAEELMLRRGYAATRVDEVIARARVTKGSFYHFFESKEALALAALDRYYEDRVGRLARGKFAAIGDPKQRALQFLDHARRLAPELWSDGCLLAGFSVDARDGNAAIAAKVEERLAELVDLLKAMLAPLTTAGLSARDLAEQFLVAIEGGIVLARAFDDPRYLRRSLDRYVQFVTNG